MKITSWAEEKLNQSLLVPSQFYTTSETSAEPFMKLVQHEHLPYPNADYVVLVASCTSSAYGAGM